MPLLHIGRRSMGGLLLPSPSPVLDYGSDIFAWARNAGNQVLTVPNGYYTAGVYNAGDPPTRGVTKGNELSDAAHDTTGGLYNGYLILQAQTPGGAILDMSPPGTTLPNGAKANGDMVLTGSDVTNHLGAVGSTSKIIFSGFKFQNGVIVNQAHNIHFWYPEVTFPFSVWSAEAGYSSGGPGTNYHGTNDTLFMPLGCVNTRWYGAYFHDIGTGPTMQSGVRSVRMTGFKIGRIDHGGRYDLIHPDGIAFLGGNIWNNDFTDFEIAAVGYGLGVNNQNLSGNWNGGVGSAWTSSDSNNNNFARGWIHDCAGPGFQINSFRKPDGTGTINNGTLTDMHFWNNQDGHESEAGYQYIQSVDTSQGITFTPGSNPQPSRITYTASGTCDSTIAQGGTDPATAWQQTAGQSSSLADLLSFFGALGWPT